MALVQTCNFSIQEEKTPQSVLAIMTYFVFQVPAEAAPSLHLSPQALNSTPQPLVPHFQDTKDKGTSAHRLPFPPPHLCA